MLSKTSIQAMYINLVKERDELVAEYENLISRRAGGECVEDELYTTEHNLTWYYDKIGMLVKILDEDVPEVKSK